MFVCLCNGVSEKTIRQVVREGASTIEQVGSCTGAGTCCGCCRSEVAAILLTEGDRKTSSASTGLGPPH